MRSVCRSLTKVSSLGRTFSPNYFLGPDVQSTLPESALTEHSFPEGQWLRCISFQSWWAGTVLQLTSRPIQTWVLSSQLINNDVGALGKYVSCGKILPSKTQKKELHQIPQHALASGFAFHLVGFWDVLFLPKSKQRIWTTPAWWPRKLRALIHCASGSLSSDLCVNQALHQN